MKLVAAPNPFKGSLGAPQAAAAISRGIRQVFPDAEVLQVPVADGGEGTVDALVAAHGGEIVTLTVEGPLGDPVQASFGLIDNGRTAVVEMAAASGLPLVPTDRRDPRIASTYGFGQLLEAARERGVERVIAGIGGSATNDGGAGMAQALGFRLLDADGGDLPRGGTALSQLARIERSGVNPGWARVSVQIASDVTNPLCGPQGASAVYGPQKGATPEMVQELDAALANFASLVERDLGVRVIDVPGAGAAGGTGAGLLAFLHAEMVRGAPLVVDASGLNFALEGASVVFTGEGRVDIQTSYGKGPVEVTRRARDARVAAVVLAGSLGSGWETLLDNGATAVVPLAEGPATLADMERESEGLVERATARACRLMAVQLQ